MLGELNSSQMENILYSEFKGRIGYAEKKDTSLLPVSYVYDGVYINALVNNLQKNDIMRNSSSVYIEVDIKESKRNWWTVTAWGELEEIKNVEQHNSIFQKAFRRIIPETRNEEATSFDMTSKTENIKLPFKTMLLKIKLTKKSGRFQMP